MTTARQGRLTAMDEQRLADADPEVGLRAVIALQRLAEQMEAVQVSNARRKVELGADRDIGVTKQAVHQKYRDLEA